MNAAQRLLDSIGAYGPRIVLNRDYRLLPIIGTPRKRKWGKDRSYRPVNITPERQLKYMHSHARRRANEDRV